MTLRGLNKENIILQHKLRDLGSTDRMENALASLMTSIQAGNSLAVTRVPTQALDEHRLPHRAAYVRLEWLDPDERPHAVVSVQCASRYWTENVPAEGPSTQDAYSTFDKLVDAVQYHYDIKTFVTDAGDAVLAWSRTSHGNFPAVVLARDDTVTTYYDAPTHIRQKLSDEERERYPPPTADEPFTVV